MSKVLLVDDESYVTATVSAKLRRMGHETLTASDGLEGFTLAQSFRPDLVVSDLQMPNLDGLGMAQRLASDDVTSATPVILLTGRGHLIPAEELAKTRVRQVLQKPFSIRDLVEKIEAALKPAA
jgi:DNA-binding response OmpR family regulator